VSASELIGAILLVLGCVCIVFACLGTALMRDTYDRLHFVAVAAMVGAPLVVVSLALDAGSWRSALKLLLIGLLLAAGGPVTSAVTARARATREGRR
jgi:monovalent cation/proton antiporter MnhG/PhaG subunit